jgi:hypothetical protein
MAIVQDCRTLILDALGESSITDLRAGLQARLLVDLNAVMQEIYGMNPGKWWAEKENGETLLAPVTLSSMTVTAASKSFSGSGLTARMHGCTVSVSGQTTQNRIFQTGASTWEFLMPHDGSTASNATITVYHDCLNLPDASMQIIRPVILERFWELLPVDDSSGLRLPSWVVFPSHDTFSSDSSYPANGWDRSYGTPSHYYVDKAQLYGGTWVLQIRVNPMPNVAYQLRWREKATFTAIASFADTRTVLIPKSYEASILYPLIYERLMDLPNFQLDKQVTADRALGARRMLAELSHTQTPSDVFINSSEANSW